MKKKIIAVISGAVILIIAAGSIYGKPESGHKEGEPDVVGTFSINRDENLTVVANRENIEDTISVIPMSNDVRKILLKHKLLNIQPVEPVPVVDDYGNIKRKISNLVFVNSQRRVWIEPNFLALINRIIKNYNKAADREHKERIENFCPHMARHTYTTLAYSVGADVKAVSEILGHASTSVTLDTYTHLTDEKKRQQEEVVKSIKVL